MSNVLIGIGGSGQHVVHAYLKTLALTVCSPRDVPHVYIIDADAKVGEAGLCQSIYELHKRLTQPAGPQNRAHFALIQPYFLPYANKAPGKASQNLELDNCPEEILDIFLTDEQNDGTHRTSNDRTVELLEGMMANAKIGATAFAFKLRRVDKNRELIELNFGSPGEDGAPKFDLLSDVRNAQVAIVGSSFGGTGSGVIPALVRYLEDLTPGPSAVRAFMTLPWFELGEGGSSAAASQLDGIDPKKRNASLGLRAYISDLSGDKPQSKANYVVSQFLGKAEVRADNGNFNQNENPHVFNMILATSIQSFLHETTDTGALPAGTEKGRKLFSLCTGVPLEAEGVFEADKSSHLRFRVKKDDNRQLLDIVLEAEVLALALEKGAEFIRPGENQFKVAGSVRQTEPDALIELCKTIATKFEKKPLEKKGTLFSKKEVAPDEVYAKLASSLTLVSETVRRSLIWVDSHIKTEERPSGIKFPSNFNHLFTVQKQAGRPDAILPATEDYLARHWGALGLTVNRKEGGGRSTELTPRTERISQAFALFMNSLFNDKNYVVELSHLAENDPSAPIYELAAQMLAGAVFAEVIEARSKSRNTDNLNDAQDNNKISGDLRAFIKGINVGAEAEGSRLCKLNQAILTAKIGDAVGSSQDPINEDHPLSLRQIDPYLGISTEQKHDISAVAKLASGAAFFQETALKGIPNVIAPLLIQKWRLSLGEDENPHEKGPLLEKQRGVRLSKFGLFQHACKVVEAGFWLTFTNDARVTLKKLSFDAALEDSHFCKLVNQELKKELQVPQENVLPTHALVLTDSQGNDKGKIVLVSHPVYGWYLPANSVARKFFGQLMPELPSVKFGKSDLDKAWSPKGIPEIWEPGTFNANLTGAFLGYCDRLLKGTQKEPWAVALKETKRCLDHLNCPDSDLKVVKVNEKIKLIKDGEITDTQLFSPEALDHIKDLLIDRPVYFFTGPESDGANNWNGLWPIKGSAWEFVSPFNKNESIPALDVVRTIDGDPAIDQRSAWQVNKLRLNLKGLGLKEIVNPFGKGATSSIPGSSEAIDPIPWGAAIWPKFEAFKDSLGNKLSDPWKCYYAGGAWDKSWDDKQYPKKFIDLDDGNSFTATGWKLNFFGDFFEPQGEKTFGLIGSVEMQMPTQLNGVPRSVELVMNGRIMGSMPIELEKLDHVHANDNDKKFDIAIDFGTSNTCLALKQSGSIDAKPLPILADEPMMDGTRLDYLTKLIGPKVIGKSQNLAEDLFREPSAPNFIFQSFNKYREGAGFGSLPSELINLRSNSYPGQADYLKSNADDFKKKFTFGPDLFPQKQMQQAVVTPHFTPFPPSPGGLEMSDLSKFMGNGIKNRFKWSSEGSAEPTENYPYRSVYLEQVLMAACATLRLSGITSVSRFIGTYPLAFKKDYMEKYAGHLDILVKKCFERTGIRLTNSEKVIMRSETISALQSINIGDDEIAVSIDMGGGTTDVGFIVPGMSRESDPDSNFFSYMSSVKFAGTHLMEALIKSPALVDLLGDINTSDEDKLNKLSIMIRSGAPLYKPSVALVAQAFFEALFEYVFGILAAIAAEPSFPEKKPINIYLFGNGFKLINVFLDREPKEFLTTVINSLKNAGLFSPEVVKRIDVHKPGADAKLSLIQGALKGQVGGDTTFVSRSDVLLANVEKVGHGRVALWYPCVRRPEGDIHQVTLGTAEQREELNNPEKIEELSLITDNEDLLKITFPITNKYWKKTNAYNPIFNNAPKQSLGIGFGQYYLEGRPGVRSGFASVVLPALAADTAANIGGNNY